MQPLTRVAAVLLVAVAATATIARAEPLTIVALGDSLTAGYQLGPGEGFPAQLQEALAAEGIDVEVSDAGVSGDTTAGGLSRLDWSVGPETDAVIVALGGNDALRGIAPDETAKNLTEIIDRLNERSIPVLLAGMLAPVNMCAYYCEVFAAVFQTLAAKNDFIFYPFFLEGVAADPSLNLPDGIHPTAEGVGVMVEGILPSVRNLIEKAEAEGA